MKKENSESSKPVVQIIVALIGSAGLILAALIARSNPSSTPAPTTVATFMSQPATLAATHVLDSNWAATFEMPLPPNTFAEGTHNYRISVECPTALQENNNVYDLEFTSSKNAPVVDGTIYLRFIGLQQNKTGNNPVESIHPSQRTSIVFGFYGMTQEESETAIQCLVKFSFDGSPDFDISPIAPFQY